MLKNRNFILLVGSQLFSVIGTTVIQFAISLYVLDVTRSSLLFSIINALAIGGRLVCLPFCGILADRFSKKKLMLVMDVLYLLFSLCLLLLTRVTVSLLWIGIVTVLMGMVSAFETPVVQSTIPLLCSDKEIPQANSLITGIGTLANIAGPVLAGIVYRFEQVYQIFAICGLLFVLAVLCELLLRLPQLEKTAAGGGVKAVIVGDLQETLTYLKRKKIIIRICLVAFMLNLFLSSFIQVMIPYIARIQLAVSNEQYGLMNTVFAAGSLAGTILYGILGHKLSHSSIAKSLFLASLLFCALAVPIGLMGNGAGAFWLMTILVAVILSVVTMVSVQLIVYIQLITDKKLLGRVMSFVMIIATLASPLGQVLFGLLGGLLSRGMTTALIVVLAVITLSISVYSRKIFAQLAMPTSETAAGLAN